jgi:Arc/MetJ-type ribon-helix-helix transcriptional regulator
VTIHLPEDLERAIKAAVLGGEFASEEEAITEAVRSFLRHRKTAPARPPGPGSIGAMRDDAELLDQAVAHAMKVREERPWRLSPGE